MKKKLLLLLMLLSAIGITNTWAQERTVTGKVTSLDDGQALPGVNVVLKGTTTGTVTDVDGNYSISVNDGNAIIIFSFIGLATEEVVVGARSVIDFQMQSDVTQLSEIVVIGYGEVDKRKLISSVASVDGDAISKMPVASFDQALQGKAAGVQVTTTSGILGSTPKVRIRGINSITSGTDPLYVVDGVPITSGELSAFTGGQTNALSDLNPADIDSYEILKDGAATAIYGSRAANGVILITTKKGVKGKAKINYSNYFGFNEAANRFELLNAEEFIQISNEKFASAGIAPQAFPGPNNEDTDWQDEILRKGAIQNHAFNISGGTEDINYYFSLGYADQEGAVDGNNLTRYSARANVDYKASEWLNAGVKLQVTHQKNTGLNTSSSGLSGNISNTLKAFPNVPIYDENHPTGYNLTSNNQLLGRGNNLQNIALNLTNIRYVIDHNQQETQNLRFLGNAYLEALLPFDIKIRTQIGVDNADTRDFQSWNPIHGDGSPTGSVYRGYYNTFQWNWQNTISWRKTLGDVHSFFVVAGTEYQKTSYDQFTGSGSDFADPFFIEKGLITGSYNTQSSSGFYGEQGFASLFGRLNYDYDNRYLASISVRRDAISQLPEDTRQDTFFGGSLGWNIAQEGFFDVSLINDLKIRGGWAETGNTTFQSNALFPALGTYGPELYGDLTAIRFENVGNPDLKWETTTKLNLGLDFSILNNRISGSIDYFTSETNDLILAAPTPPLLGIPQNSINLNVGKMENKGVEIAISSVNMEVSGFRWTSNFNATFAKNEVTALSNDDADIISVFNIVRVGEPIGAIYGWESAGINPANGNPMYITADGRTIQGNPDDNSYYLYDPNNPTDLTPTTALSQGDKKVIGQSNPKVFGGFTNTFTYKGFDLGLVLTYAFGQKVFNGTRQNGLTNFFNNNLAEIKNRWTPANPNTDVARLSLNNDNFLNYNSSLNSGNAETRWLEDGNYVRVQNISLGYTFPSNVISKLKLEQVRVFAQVQNAHVFTKYKGLDPELNVSRTSNIIAGVDLNTNPLMRTWTIGLNVTF